MYLRLTFELDGRRLRHHVGVGEHAIGSAPDCALRVPYAGVSRRHAILRVEDDTAVLEDVGSSNGTWIEGRRLVAGTPLSPGQRGRIGPVAFHVESTAAEDGMLAVSLSTPSASVPDEAPSQRTLSVSGWSRDLCAAIGEIAACAHAGEAPLALAAHVGRALCDALGLDGIELSEVGDKDMLLFRTGDVSPPALQTVASGPIRACLHATSSPGRDIDAPVRVCLDILALAFRPARPAAPGADAIEGAGDVDAPVADPTLREIYRRAAQVAASDLHVLIRGESGTGKEVLAQYLRQHASRAAERPFVALNCAALPEDLLDVELFGIEKGVATGVDARAGKFEQAHGGTLFLDEIGDMHAATQARILRVLQEGEVTRIGGSTPRAARVRVIAATNKNLDAMVADGRFRLDLLHRIADWQVVLPPLRERPRDILQLGARFLERACAARGVRVRGISRAAADALLAHEWPGNVRELEREMARAAVFLHDGDALTRDDLNIAARDTPENVNGSLREQLECAERRILHRAMARAGGNAREVAERLGIARSTLYRRFAALGMSETVADPSSDEV